MPRSSMRTWLWAGVLSIGLGNVAVAGGPYPFTQEWYAERAGDPPGARQVESHGKLWPPFQRPVGRKATKVHNFHYAHYWPYPHNIEDEAYVRNIFELQTSNGWVQNTTLWEYHFDPETHQWTDEGRTHLLWVSQSVPPQFRTVYVAQTASPESTQMRVANAEQYYREQGVVNAPAIISRASSLVTRPAVEIDQIRRMELMSMPRPRLFFVGSATAGTGAGGGVAGGAGGPAGGAGATTTGNGGSTSTR